MDSIQAQSIEKIVALIRANEIKISDIEQALQYSTPAVEPEQELKKSNGKKKSV
jgi:hypothetical protein